AVAVLHIGLQTFNENMPHLSGAIDQRVECKLNVGILRVGMQEHQGARCCMAGKNRKVDAMPANGGAQRKWRAAADAMSGRSCGGRPIWCWLGERSRWHIAQLFCANNRVWKTRNSSFMKTEAPSPQNPHMAASRPQVPPVTNTLTAERNYLAMSW